MVTSGDLAATRGALHAICEHVLAAALYAETGHIGLRVTPGGLATPEFGPDNRVVTLGAQHVTVTDRTGTRFGPITTLRAVARLAGIEPGLPADVYPLATTLLPDAPLEVDAGVAGAIIDWYTSVSSALSAFAPDSRQTLWPEHLDIAIRRDEGNFGGLAGDGAIADPYVYVGPDSVATGDPFFTEAFGAARTWTETPTPGLVAAFFADGARRVSEIRATGP